VGLETVEPIGSQGSNPWPTIVRNGAFNATISSSTPVSVMVSNSVSGPINGNSYATTPDLYRHILVNDLWIPPFYLSL